MEQKLEREWKSIVCLEGEEKAKALIMCDWAIVSEKGRILNKTLKQTDCHSPKLTEFGGSDCNWPCEKVIAKGERRNL